MAVVAVTFQGAPRVNDSDTNSGWGKVNVGGGAPAAEGANKYQGTNVVGNQIKAALGGLDYDPGAGAVDMTLAANQLWFVKCVITDSADLVTTTGAEIWCGSSNANYHIFTVAGTNSNRGRFTTWPAQGGYLIFGLNPNVAAWRETPVGNPDLTQVDYFGFVCQMQTGFSKSENMGLDAIDIGTGLLLVGGDGGDPDGTFASFVASDQDIVNNRWGVVTQPLGSGSPITCNGRLDIGSATATEFTSSGEVIIYPDGYHANGDVGVLVDLQNALTSYSDSSSHTGLGSITTEDTRPDYVFTGTSGTASLSGTLENFNRVTLTSAVTADGASLSVKELTQAGANIQNCTIETTSLSGVSCLGDPQFGTTTLLNNTEFVQAGAGHALTLDTATTYNFTGLTFTGYGANTTASAAVLVSAPSGTTTINVSGTGNTPTYFSAGATVVINNTKTVKVTVVDAITKAPIQNARVLLEADTGGDLSAGTDILVGLTNASGVIEDAGFSYTNDQPVTGRVRKSSDPGPYYKTGGITGTITTNGFDTTILLALDQ